MVPFLSCFKRGRELNEETEKAKSQQQDGGANLRGVEATLHKSGIGIGEHEVIDFMLCRIKDIG